MAGRVLVALKMANEDESMDKMIKLQLKLTPRSANLAIRTRVLIFCKRGWRVSFFNPPLPLAMDLSTYQVSCLLLVGELLSLLEDLLFPESGTLQSIGELPSRCAGHPHGALERRSGRHGHGDRLPVASDVAKPDITRLGLGKLGLL